MSLPSSTEREQSNVLYHGGRLILAPPLMRSSGISIPTKIYIRKEVTPGESTNTCRGIML
jgi:hypothetical protein